MNSRTYEIGRSKISLIFGDITTTRAEVLVSSDDYYISMGGGVSAAIRRAGGSVIAADASKMTPANLGDVVVSTAGTLPAKYIFHAVTIGEEEGGLSPDAVVRQATLAAMDLLRRLNCRSIAFPAIGAGLAGIPYEVVAAQMAVALVGFLLDAPETYEVELFLMDRFGRKRPDDYFMFFEEFAAQKLGLSASAGLAQNILEAPEASAQGMSPKLLAQARRRRQVFMMLRHLDSRRNEIEAAVLRSLSAPDAPGSRPLPELEEKLESIRRLRRNYEAELEPSEAGATAAAGNSVFVSSTSRDLKQYREAVKGVINGLKLKFIGMEEFAPTAQAPVDLIRSKVMEGRIYLGILGMRYGYVDPGAGLSMTELEYRQAIASDKKIQMFVMDQNAPITAGMVEDDPLKFARLVEFRGRVMKDHTCALFTDPNDLAAKAEAALREAVSA
jgi:O-acetyl-ADP-ribose deacetylase (regulator of RNase III)